MLRASIRLVCAATLVAACSGGGDSSSPPVTPPPSTPTVATVEVTPTTATLVPPATVQLTAVTKDAQGTVLTGRTISWSSSASTVATVSTSGLVTSVASGSATITATSDGKQGTAVITVVSHPDGPVVARGDIGALGGTLGSGDVAITIAAGVLSNPSTIELVRDTLRTDPVPEQSATGRYLIDGLPADRVVPMRVRIKTNKTVQGTTAIAIHRPVVQYADSTTVAMGMNLVVAAESSGYLVATVSLKGRPSTWGGSGLPMSRVSFGRLATTASASVDPRDLKGAAELSGLMQLTHAASANGHFDVWGIGPDPDMPRKVTKTAALAEQAYDKVVSMGYSVAHRQMWPIEVYLVRATWNGCFYSVLPFPVDPENGYIAYNSNNVDLGWFPGTVIHEFFHFTQGGFLLGKDWPAVAPARWLGEATSTWIAGYHPAVALPFTNPTAISWRDSMWVGLNPDMIANSGYGKAPIIKYITKRWGDDKVKEMYSSVRAGVNPITALLTAVPEAHDTWWPDFISQQVSAALYPWPNENQLVSRKNYSLTLQAGRSVYDSDPLFTLGVETDFLKRDTASFAANYQVPVFLDTASSPNGTLVAIYKTAAMTTYRHLATGDTVKIPGHLLQRPDQVAVLVTRTDPLPPYNNTRTLGYRVDLSPPEGDWRFKTITGLNNGFRFTCDREGASVEMDPVANATQVWDMLASSGTWKKSVIPAGALGAYTWQVRPEVADTLRMLNMTLQSTMTVLRADTIRLQGRMTLDWSGASSMVGISGRTSGAGLGDSRWWYLLAPLCGLPLVIKRRRRALGVFVATAMVAMLASCGVGQIAMKIDESFDYTFTRLKYTADPAKPNDPLMLLVNGKGETKLNAYRSEYWTYTTGTGGVKDSVRTLCTGTGTSTYTVSGAAYTDGVTPPSSSSSNAIDRLSLAFGRDLRPMAPAIQSRLR